MTRAREAFEAWCRSHPAQWNLNTWSQRGVFQNYIDPETDTAWLGFQAAWELRLVVDDETFNDSLEVARLAHAAASEVTREMWRAEEPIADMPDALAAGIKTFLANLMLRN